MSAQTMAEAWAPVEAHNRELMARHTFGHLAPKRGKTYKGEMLFCQSAYGDLVPIRADFAGLPDSPWLYEALIDFIEEHATEAGKVYKFTGTICNYQLAGTVEKLQ